MNKEFIPYEEALALKELGFNKLCFGGYVKLTYTQTTFFMNNEISEIDYETPLHPDLIVNAPLYQQAFRWFREEYNLWAELIWMNVELEGFKKGTSGRVKSEKRTEFISTFNTYEEAELACLRKLIEIVNQNKDE